MEKEPVITDQEIIKPKEDTVESKANFRISFFGTSIEKSEHDKNAIKLATELAVKITRDDQHKIITGGYESGIMGAVSNAAQKEAQALGRNDLKPEGITLGDQIGKPSSEADITEAETLQKRLEDLIDESNAVIVLHGNMGTVLELLNALWSYTVERIKGRDKKDFIPKPIIIADSSLEHSDLLAFLKRRDVGKFGGAMKDVYIVGPSGFDTSEKLDQTTQTIDNIIESYYKMSLGQNLSENEKEKLKKLSLEEFFKQQEYFTEGAGI